jgi:hypothetical protein
MRDSSGCCGRNVSSVEGDFAAHHSPDTKEWYKGQTMGKWLILRIYLTLKVQQAPLFCKTQEQLEVFLARAGPTPLDIHVKYPPAFHLLKMISSCNHSINSLSLWDHSPKFFSHSVQYEDVKDLNLRSLEKLDLRCISFKEAEMFMDLALQSTREKITLHLENLDVIKTSLLTHGLLKRLHGLSLSASEFYSILSSQLTKTI